MILVTDVKEGTAIQLDGKVYKILGMIRHAGAGQTHGFVELKLKDVRFGHFADRHFKSTDKLEDVQLEHRVMDYLYADKEACWFMDPVTFDQVSVPKSAIGSLEKFMKEGMKITVEILAGEAISINFPKVVELKVSSTGPGVHEAQVTTMKPATLENGVEVLVPQFIETGDMVRVDTEKLKYVDRASIRHM